MKAQFSTIRASTMNNFSEYTFSLENLNYIPNIYEKIFIVLVWLLIEIPGNIMLLGIIQFDRLGGDPLKRRIHDQVSNGQKNS